MVITVLLGGCATGMQDGGEASSTASEASGYTQRVAAQPRLTLLNTFQGEGPPLRFLGEPGAPSYVFRGDAVTLSVPTYRLWPELYPDLPEPYTDLPRHHQLHAVLHVTGSKAGVPVTDDTVTTRGLRGGDGTSTFDTYTDATAYTVPAGVDTLTFTMDVTDDFNGATKTLPWAIGETAVLGASLPDKTLLFDEVGGPRRVQVLEGGKPVEGSTLTVAFTDYRADNVVEAYHVDRTIGRGKNGGARDEVQDIFGDLEHEVSVGYSFDGAWRPEQLLSRQTPSRFVQGYGRHTFEGVLIAPAGAQRLATYFHVKTFLRYAYSHSQYHEVTLDQAEGSRKLVREKWDNLQNIVGRNYDFDLEAR